MAVTILGRKVGMTRAYTEGGKNIPVTVIAAGPCYVSQIKTPDKDGYAAIQLAYEDIKPRRSTIPLIKHDHKAGIAPKKFHREVRLEESELGGYELGQELTVAGFEGLKFVDVTATSKGKGFQGVMKRHNFKGQLQTHGVERKHRSPGSIGGRAAEAGKSGGMKKGARMSGHMGHTRVTMRNLDVVAIDTDNNLLVVKGAVPGPNGGFVMVRQAKRLWKQKAKQAS